MATRYIVSAPTIAALRTLIERANGAAAIGYKEDTQAVVIIDPATGAEVTLGTFNGDPGGITVAEDEIVVGQAGDVGASVPLSGDATIDATGALTVVEVGGEAAADIAAAAALVANISAVNVASPEIWNDAGTLKVGTV